MNKVFFVSCFANYSHDFGWDDGLGQMSHGITRLEPSDGDTYLDWNLGTYWDPEIWDLGDVHEHCYNDHGGSRETWLYVVASNIKEAEKFFNDYIEEENKTRCYYRIED